MTNQEARDAMLGKSPVVHNGLKYSCISAIIYRPTEDGGIRVTAELIDKCGHSVTIASVKDVEKYMEV